MSVYIFPPVSVTTLPPVGGATSANQVVQNNLLQKIANRTIVEFLYFDYMTDGPVNNTDYVELIASTSDDIFHMTWFESSGFPMVVALGAASSEVDLFVVPPGGFNGELPFPIPAGSRVSIKELVPDAIELGAIVANFLK